jgi:DNA-binding MarR family transcriptional regulator
MREISDSDYARLLEFRTGLRRFTRWSEEAAEAEGITPAQHQLLLAVRGHPEAEGPTIKDVASYLVAKHHSTVELVDRACAAGLLRRVPDAADHRSVRLRLTADGRRRLANLSRRHLEELEGIAPQLGSLVVGVDREPTRA